jgi:response regulator RpfG family c-di-GMP phosphodiesterase
MLQDSPSSDLYLARVLLQGIGGKLTVRSEKSGGTTLTAVIPRRWWGSQERVNALLSAAELSRKEARARLDELRRLLSMGAGEGTPALSEDLEALAYKVQELVVLCNRSLFLADDLSTRLESEQERILQQEVEQLATLEAMLIISREIARSAHTSPLFDLESARRVAKNVLMMGNEFRLSRSELQALHYAALLKDLGLVSCPEDMLEQEVVPTLEEAVNLRKRFSVMWRALSRLGFLSPALVLIWHRHERYDGTGHPFGIKGTNIPLGARILAIADSFDAMTSGLSPQGALAPEVAVQKLVAESGRRYDPDMVTVFLRAWRKKEFEVASVESK